MFSRDVLTMYRALIAGAAQDPRLNLAFYETGSAPTIAGLAGLLAHYDKQKLLDVSKMRRGGTPIARATAFWFSAIGTRNSSSSTSLGCTFLGLAIRAPSQ
jgi:hypothetical protein